MTRLLSIVVSYRVVSRMVRISSSVEPSSIHPANAMRAVIKKDIEINETDEANKKKVSLNSSPMLPAKKETKKIRFPFPPSRVMLGVDFVVPNEETESQNA